MNSIRTKAKALSVLNLYIIIFLLGAVLNFSLMAQDRSDHSTVQKKKADRSALTITKIGQMPATRYNRISLYGDYAFCPTNDFGTDILDTRHPEAPVKVANYPHVSQIW
ncbi:MAG: hypothetical protein ACM3SY_14445 [Candidatus Omnitrophota bacterium]